MKRIFKFIHHLFPFVCDERTVFEVELFQDQTRYPLLVKFQRNLFYHIGVFAFYQSFFGHSAMDSEFSTGLGIQRFTGATNQDIRMNAQT